MPQTTMTFRVDNTLKQQFDQMCDAFGFSNTAALTVFMKAVVRERRIPFEIRIQSEHELRMEAWLAVKNMQADAQAAGITDLSLDEINSIINETRNS